MDFFVSYTSQDRKWAEWIAWQLEQEDWECVIQAWDFKPGDDFVAKMREAHAQSKKTLAVLSRASLASKFAAAEVNAAIRASIDGGESRLLPVRIEDCDVPDLLGNRVFIDLFEKNEADARRDLIQGVRASLATRLKPKEAVRFPVKPAFPSATEARRSGEVGAEDARRRRRTVPSPEIPRRAAGPMRMLFLACDAGIGLQLDKELHQIEDRLRPAVTAGGAEVHARFDVNPEDVLPSLNSVSPHVLHFAGNMTGDAIILGSERQGIRTVAATALVGLLRAAGSDLRLVFLNACRSLPCAEQLREVADCTIGVREEIVDAAAVQFASDFYGALGLGRSVGNAYEQARANLTFSGVDPGSPPELLCRDGVDASSIVLAPRVLR